MGCSLGRVLLVANPTSQSGKGRHAASQAASSLRDALGEASLAVRMTEYAGHASSIVADEGAAFDTVIALGGDGVIHEVVNGLMRIGEAHRPALGVVPVGSGNDYARTLGMSDSVAVAVDQLVGAPHVVSADLGLCNGVYFMETLSFGFDAAMALDTVELRKQTGRTGGALYLQAGLRNLAHGIPTYRFDAVVDGFPDHAGSYAGESVIFAVQMGPTYGGGFRVCPDAKIDDGLFDICIASGPMGRLEGLATLLRAKDAHHVNMKSMRFIKGSSLKVRFDRQPPAQVDGEEIIAQDFDVSVAVRAIRVLVPHGK